MLELLININQGLFPRYTMLESTHNEMVIYDREADEKFKITIEAVDEEED